MKKSSPRCPPLINARKPPLNTFKMRENDSSWRPWMNWRWPSATHVSAQTATTSSLTLFRLSSWILPKSVLNLFSPKKSICLHINSSSLNSLFPSLDWAVSPLHGDALRQSPLEAQGPTGWAENQYSPDTDWAGHSCPPLSHQWVWLLLGHQPVRGSHRSQFRTGEDRLPSSWTLKEE